MMIYATSALIIFTLLQVEVCSRYCDGGHYCVLPKECCEDGCCYTYPPLPHPSLPQPSPPPYRALNIFVYNHWYFWCVVGAATAVGVCAWWAWRRRAQLCACACCCESLSTAPSTDRDSAGSCYLPPHYSRCNSFHRAPPPYTEVTSKPDMYPLVITYGDSGDKGGPNYLMVHYFRNYIIRPSGSISAASTADSLNSSFMCNAANEANSVVPPPYSCTGSFEEWRGISGGGGPRAPSPRAALLRSLSSLTCEPHRSVPPRSVTAPLHPFSSPVHTAPLRIDDQPVHQNDQNSHVEVNVHRHHPTEAFLRALEASTAVRIDMSPEAEERRNNFRTNQGTRYTIDDIDFDLLEYDIPGYGACRALVENPHGPRLGVSPPPASAAVAVESPTADETDLDSLRRFFISMVTPENIRPCESPPRPTSPTMESRESNRRGKTDEPSNCLRSRSDAVKIKKTISKGRKSSLYMPLSSTAGAKCSRVSPSVETATSQGSFVHKAFSISAPTTPCGAGVLPTLLTFSQKVSGSVLSSRSSKMNKDESNPLLSEYEEYEDRTDGQF